MTVGRILDIKGKAVVTVDASLTLEEASRRLAEHRIGAVVITGPGQVIAGILSERDIIRALAQRGASALAESVSAHMTKRVVTCVAATTIPEIMGIMTTGKFRHVPVVKDGKLDGMISIGDVVKHRFAELEHESRTLRDYITAS